jgi:hypothetical protein
MRKEAFPRRWKTTKQKNLIFLIKSLEQYFMFFFEKEEHFQFPQITGVFA